VRERAAVREKRSLIGYDADKVQAHFNLLQMEIKALEKQRRQEHQIYMAETAELSQEIEKMKEKVHELDQMEKGLKQWIQRNQ
jgi:cell division septum initiation protein DivIVA